MGEVISLEQRRRARADGHPRPTPSSGRPTTTLFFDLGSPGTYFAAERAERLFPGLRWRPALLEAAAVDVPSGEAVQAAAVARAAALHMPLVWPERHPAVRHAAMRVASFAGERGQAATFVLAASRLAFCGGFDLEDPEILAEAAAAAALPLDECLRAAGDRSRDEAMLVTGRRLVSAGACELPAVRVGRRLFCGEERLSQAAAAVRDPCAQPRRDESAG